MPILQHPRHEAFAQARAKGARLDDAYEDAGFAPGNGHASRLALRPEVAERIGELRADCSELTESNTQAVIGALLRISKAGEALASPGGIKEARETLMQAWRLSNDLAHNREMERRKSP
jgi:hypothetical protein